MIEALKYCDPLWYFNLKPEKSSNFYFPDYRKLSPEEKLFIDFDSGYKKLSLADAAFQAMKNGIILTDPSKGLDISSYENIPLEDQYRFVKKYYHFGWVLYFCLVRIAGLKNPLKEIKAFLQSIHTKRKILYNKSSKYFPEKPILSGNPTISIVLPTLNRYGHLKNILTDLSLQTITIYEIIVVDQSEPRDLNFYDQFKHLPLRIIYQEKKGQWLARNEAIRNSTGDFILLIDDDSRVKSDWIENHLKCIQFFNVDISAGVTLSDGSVARGNKSFFHWAEEFDSGNAMVKRSLFKDIGLFDNAYNGIRMGDTEFGLRAYLKGYTSISNPNANRIHKATSEGGMRFWGSRNSFRPSSFFRERVDVGALYIYRKYFDKEYLFSLLLVRIFLSFIPKHSKKHFLAYLTGAFLFIILLPWWSYQLKQNFNRATSLRPYIPELDAKVRKPTY